MLQSELLQLVDNYFTISHKKSELKFLAGDYLEDGSVTAA